MSSKNVLRPFACAAIALALTTATLLPCAAQQNSPNPTKSYAATSTGYRGHSYAGSMGAPGGASQSRYSNSMQTGARGTSYAQNSMAPSGTSYAQNSMAPTGSSYARNSAQPTGT